jgi:hypothetical protein
MTLFGNQATARPPWSPPPPSDAAGSNPGMAMAPDASCSASHAGRLPDGFDGIDEGQLDRNPASLTGADGFDGASSRVFMLPDTSFEGSLAV